VTKGADVFWRQSESHFTRWQGLLRTDPARLLAEARLYLRWLRRMNTASPDDQLICDVLIEMTLELMIEATLKQ
jgi:hypothetical protein